MLSNTASSEEDVKTFKIRNEQNRQEPIRECTAGNVSAIEWEVKVMFKPLSPLCSLSYHVQLFLCKVGVEQIIMPWIMDLQSKNLGTQPKNQNLLVCPTAVV